MAGVAKEQAHLLSARSLVEILVKPPMWLLGVGAPGYSMPQGTAEGPFASLSELMDTFRHRRPEGRWMVWVRGADHQVVLLDSQKWDLAKVY